ncbi:hypothetical protein AAFF_G00233040 [Aldrovandia affinis]|uniref:Uncharacterized protein n=1 Tax=Aldrovandia affinis TaxID=143900 RepID=A0AAD7RER2_9TELE|nr:hypothetical protein AAFF_G00233040 [Aldrovandia affinis]
MSRLLPLPGPFTNPFMISASRPPGRFIVSFPHQIRDTMGLDNSTRGSRRWGTPTPNATCRFNSSAGNGITVSSAQDPYCDAGSR